jgi:ABC-type transporter Mla subunit MlaD
VIPASRTATPVEVDQLYSSLAKLANALGPNGVNKNGALSDAINTGAANLAGSNGKNFNNMIRDLGQATRTLSGSRDNFFATINNLQQFTTMLKNNNSQVALAQQQLAQVFGFLSGDRQALAGALSQLSTALGQVQSFIANNRNLITSNVTKLASITKILVTERASLAQAVSYAPLAVDNVLGAYNPVQQTLNGRGNLLELETNSSASAPGSPASGTPAATTPKQGSGSGNLFCDAARSASPLGSLCRRQQAPAVGALVPVSPQQRASLPPLPLPAVGPVYGSGSTAAGSGG